MKTLLIQPQNLPFRTPQEWRIWLNDLTVWQHDLLHNHTPDGGDIYRYPLVQFRHDGFVGIAEGEELLMKILPLLLAETQLKIDSKSFEIEMSDKPKQYRLINWQPFHAVNFEEWNNTTGLVDRVLFLEQILTGHILGFCKALNFVIPNKSLKIKLLSPLEEFGFKRFSSQNNDLWRLTFGITFEANIVLPELVGLGKGISKGKGVLRFLEEKKERVVEGKEILSK
jgi:hypothetical protein